MQYFFVFYTIGAADILHPSPAPRFKTFQVFLNYFLKLRLQRNHLALVSVSGDYPGKEIM